ncbi:hypothetical protein [Streptomyces sp. NPDC001500]
MAVDAFAVRLTLVPAVLALAGRHVRWLPARLDRVLPAPSTSRAPAPGRPACGTRNPGTERVS